MGWLYIRLTNPCFLSGTPDKDNALSSSCKHRTFGIPRMKLNELGTGNAHSVGSLSGAEEIEAHWLVEIGRGWISPSVRGALWVLWFGGCGPDFFKTKF